MDSRGRGNGDVFTILFMMDGHILTLLKTVQNVEKKFEELQDIKKSLDVLCERFEASLVAVRSSRAEVQ